MAFRVLVDDNFHPYDESERYEEGVYDTLDQAMRVCRAIVDRELAHQYTPGMTADELYGRYTSFGEDPFIRDTEHSQMADAVPFSAWTYAQRRSEQMCAE